VLQFYDVTSLLNDFAHIFENNELSITERKFIVSIIILRLILSFNRLNSHCTLNPMMFHHTIRHRLARELGVLPDLDPGLEI